ncbi:hypothetical protein [Kitasatospora sp. NPDC101183]|uniref:hypothetical protein n=1 Tax=Kitasatospora sp. NPDC101183 TaxID=3364100 RepID=UPI0037F63318
MATGERQRQSGPKKDDGRASPEAMAAILEEYRVAEAKRRKPNGRKIHASCGCRVHAGRAAG